MLTKSGQEGTFSFYRWIDKDYQPQSRPARTTGYSFTTYHELRTTHRFSRRAAPAARSGIQTGSPTRDYGSGN